MKPDDFEQLLQRQPLRPPPAEWRDAILVVAQSSAACSPLAPCPSPLASRLREWLWPHPVAWAGVAASWVLIAALNSAAGGPPLAALLPMPMTGQVLATHAVALEEAFAGAVPGLPAPPTTRSVNPPARRPGTTWIPAYEEEVA